MSTSSLSKTNSVEHKENEPSSETHSFLGMRGNRLNFCVSCIAGLGFLLFGYDQGVMGSLLTLKSFRKTFPSIDTKGDGDATLQGAAIALYEIGCMFSALSTIYLGDKLGRLKTIFLGATIMMVGGALQSCAYTLAHLIVARIITGLGNGFITATVPVWQAEVAKPEMRGKLIMMEGSLIALGITISYWVDFAFYFLDGWDTINQVSWRFPVAFQCIFPIIILPLILKFPESPRWLLKRKRQKEARIVFSALYDLPENDPLVNDQITEIQQAIDLEISQGAENFNMKDLLKQGEARNFHRTVLAACSQMMQQITGINLITYYAGTIFENYIGMDPLQSRILAACNGTEYFLASLLAFYTIERFGRRNLMIYGALGQSFCMAILTGTNWKADEAKDTHAGTSAGIAAAVFLFLFNTCFGMSYLGVTWLLPPELLPLQIRAPGAAISTATNWAFNFMVVMITPVAFSSIGPYTYTIFAAINLLMVPTVYFLYPETAGRSLEEMDVIFNQTPVMQPWKAVQVAKDLPFMHAGVRDPEKGPTTSHFEHASATSSIKQNGEDAEVL
ncbi:uncharacterized protein AC631_03871 [Debaryomyces fabryi]|uniref:Major facilitator superfamily (MFS) profile domain-containing protein n=1 Tax=Debaryomyces fabryi TaxID=58627 RepID=A0A0V1PVZ1_9ASCO|nr:uncharacterized protein AC631_03871 [Debaryomyces fabryi]KSA00355.1 hypothetical protein AC631_03871 [Debaryomyces fabryi]CUM57200.1 unnamed protein product [Debaryomyces fabryi]